MDLILSRHLRCYFWRSRADIKVVGVSKDRSWPQDQHTIGELRSMLAERAAEGCEYITKRIVIVKNIAEIYC